MQSTTAEPNEKKYTYSHEIEEKNRRKIGRMNTARNEKPPSPRFSVQFTVKVFEREWKMAYNNNHCTKLSMKAQPK